MLLDLKLTHPLALGYQKATAAAPVAKYSQMIRPRYQVYGVRYQANTKYFSYVAFFLVLNAKTSWSSLSPSHHLNITCSLVSSDLNNNSSGRCLFGFPSSNLASENLKSSSSAELHSSFTLYDYLTETASAYNNKDRIITSCTGAEPLSQVNFGVWTSCQHKITH
jgi:hypothetical protein